LINVHYEERTTDSGDLRFGCVGDSAVDGEMMNTGVLAVIIIIPSYFTRQT
jgi:hypothetical protein